MLVIGFIAHLLSAWNSPQIPTIPCFKPSPINNSNYLSPLLQVKDLISAHTLSWNLPLITSLFTSSSVAEILKLKIPLSISSPFLWTPANGFFFFLLMVYFPLSRLISL